MLFSYPEMHWNRNLIKGDDQHTKVSLSDIFIGAEIAEIKNSLSTVLIWVAE